ncbi:uncharacterized protein FFFS_16011 [Fusarium fujikuroi]|nr:uncharacterized protein FFFS_16011 [Fusarium fujikuroi]
MPKFISYPSLKRVT